MDITSELGSSLSSYLDWNKARLHCFVQMIVALLSVKTVNLVEWAVVFKGKAKQDPAYMRIRRFFRSFDINLDVIASLLFSWFGLEGKQIYLTLDRTNCKLGNWNINILMLGVVKAYQN